MYKVGLIGCGNIAETYFRSQIYFNNIKIISCADINVEAAKKCANQYNIHSMLVDDMLANDDIDIILNLTPPQVHYDVIKKTLLVGKHSYCEKPLSIKFEQGQELVNLAKENNLYLGNAPDTFLGAGGQLSRQLIDSGDLGEIKLGNFIFACPGLESWHPNPEPWFQEGGGPIIDMGPYFYTMLVNLLGPAKNIRAHSTTVSEYREIGSGLKQGKKFKVEIPTSYMLSIEFHKGAIIQGFISFDVINHQRNHMELYGTKGSIIVPDPNMFGGPVFVSFTEGGEWKECPTEDMRLGKINIKNHSGRSNEAATNANYRGIGLSEMIDCIENNNQHRCNGELVLHVLDMIDLTIKAARTSTLQSMRTTCDQPRHFTENKISRLMK